MQLQFTKQIHQEECIKNIISIFDNLYNQGMNFEDSLNKVYTQKDISNSKNIDILMETGTGKTFTFIKTMFELNHNFGFKKFMILVPSLPIREGTRKNLEITKEYFKSIYSDSKDREIEVNVYQGELSVIYNFINDDKKFSVLILTPDSFNQKSNKLNRKLEKDLFNIKATTLLEAVKEINPIIIMDEPHRYSGEKFLEYFEGFKNYVLRFGATFPKNKDNKKIGLSNVAYMLDGVSSFKKNLVKKITVYNNEIINDKDTIVSINKDKVKIRKYINGEACYKDLERGDKFNNSIIRKINNRESNIVLDNKDIVYCEYLLKDEDIRLMISNTINIHFKKEKDLFNKGIKTLSLFFIKEIKDYRVIDNNKTIVKDIFEEEYKKIRRKIIEELKGKSEYLDYLKYLKRDYSENGKLLVHNGYFSGDKGSKDEKILKGIDDILNNKEKLLSFDTTTRFIFSVWALQEGWDNPNVFTICKLSNRGSDISKIQQVGRGLRICVNQNGDRLTRDKFQTQTEFWNINNLDIIISSEESNFIEQLQKEIVDNSLYLSDEFTRIDLTEKLNANNIDIKIVRKLEKFLLENNLIIDLRKTDSDGLDIYKKSNNFFNILSDLKYNNSKSEAENGYLDIARKIFDEDMKHYITDGNKIKEKKKLIIKDYKLNEFKKLWDYISKKAYYTIKDLNEDLEQKLINNIIEKINNLKVESKSLQYIKYNLAPERIEEVDSISKEIISMSSYEENIDYVLFIKELSEKTKMPVYFIIAIFNGINRDKFEIVNIIKNFLMGDIKTLIEYNFIKGEINTGIMYDIDGKFKKQLDAGSLGKNQEDAYNFSLKEEWIFKDIIEYDSEFEKDIILKDPKIEQIKIFSKLPKFSIPTPIGNYTPDFCYIIETNKNKKIFLIVESKGYDSIDNISNEEKLKINFAKKFFDKMNSIDKNVKIYYKERINKTQLSDLIKEVIND